MPESPAKPFSGIFVCYRRDDTDSHVDLLRRALSQRFGRDRIFVDIDSIRMGENFRTVIEESLSSSKILIAMIGRYWLASVDKKGRRRLDDPNDPVRVEIATALKRNITVIPILVYGAGMPSPEDLPDDLAELALRNAVELSRRYWDQDVDLLLGTMEEIFAELDDAAEEDERRTAEEEYVQAEDRRCEREEEKRRAAEQAAVRSEEDRRLRDAETRKKEEEARRQEAERRLQDEAAQRRVEERAVAEAKKLAEEQLLRREAIAVTSKRNLVIGAVVLVVFAGVAFLIWSLSGKTTRQDATSKPEPSQETAQTSSRPSSTLPHTRTNQAGIEFVLIPPGRFMMGSTNGGSDEKPVHEVTINYSFYMGKYEVTQGQWQAVMGNDPSNFKDCGGNCPVEPVSWDDAQSFINKLNERGDGFRYRLPTEAEWEYACRAGTTGGYAGNLSEMAWYSDNSGSRTHAVGQKQPNAWGLADMHGNVWEWCQDWHHPSYDGAPSDGSAWLSGGEQNRVLRGGSWVNAATNLRSANRSIYAPDVRVSLIGFRLVAVVRTS